MRNTILLSALTVTSLENLEPEAAETAELNPVTDQTVVEIDEILEEVRDGAADVEEHDDAVEELEGAAESLESLIASLESAIADGGMNPQAADIHSRAMINAVRRLPVDGSQYTVSVESFGGTGDKLQASMEAMEGAKDLLAKIWAAISSAVKSAWAAAVKFVDTLGKSGEVIVRAGTQLKSSAVKVNGKPKTETVPVGAAGKFLHTNGKVEGPLSQSLQRVKMNGDTITTIGNVAVKGLKTMAGNGAVDIDTFITSITEPLGNMDLPGGRTFEVAAGSAKLVEKTKLEDAAQEVPTPERPELVAIASNIIAIGKMIASYDQKQFKEIAKAVDAGVATYEGLVKKAGDNKEEVASLKAAMANFKRATAASRAAGPAYMSYAANAAKSAFGFGKKALAAY